MGKANGKVNVTVSTFVPKPFTPFQWAAMLDVDEIRRHIGADSLGYLSLEGLLHAADGGEEGYCTACWSRRYPVELPPAEAEQLRLFGKSRR